MAHHTQSPWHADETLRMSEPSAGIDIGAADGSNIALVHHDYRDREPRETKANARLIAAAPELLLALNAAEPLLLVAWHEAEKRGDSEFVARLRPTIAAIDALRAKVEGR